MSRRCKRYVRSAAKPKAASCQHRFLELPGGSATITAVGALVVALIGLVGILVNAQINAATQREAQAKARATAAAEQLTGQYWDYIEEQRKFVFDAAGLVGQCSSAADGLIKLTGPDFDLARHKGIEDQRFEMAKKFNDCALQWNDEYNKLSLGMDYYHSGQPAVAGAWGEVQRANTVYMNCAQQWYMSHNDAPGPTAGACNAEKDELTKRIEDFNREVSAARRQALLRQSPAAAVEADPHEKPGQVVLVKQ